MPRVCKICIDDHRDKIDEYFLKYKSIVKTKQWSDKEFNKDYSYEALKRHFRYHVVSIIEAGKKASVVRQQAITRDIYQNMEISQTLTKNFKYLSDQIGEMKREAKTEKQRNEILKFMSKINDTVELLMKFQKEFSIDIISSEEDLEKKILYCVENLDIEDKKDFLKRWYSYHGSNIR